MKKINQDEKVSCASKIIICIMMACFLSVCYQFLAKNVGYDILGISNSVFLKTIKTSDILGAPQKIDINWSDEYPFDEIGAYNQKELLEKGVLKNNNTVADGKIGKIYTTMDKYTKEYFSFYDECKCISMQFNNIVGYSIVTDAYGSSRLFLENGHMTYERKDKDISDEIYNFVNFSEWLDDEGILYFHVIIPAPVGNMESELKVQKSGYAVYSNKMANDLRLALENNNIDYLDLRDNFELEGLDYDNYFYKYDHHMIPEAGLWAAGKVSNKIDSILGVESEKEAFDINNYFITSGVNEYGIMNNRFFVYKGKDDMHLLHPTYKTNIQKYVADYDMELTGSFDDVMFCMWNYPTYNVWNHGIDAIKTYRNTNGAGNQIKILLLTESYSDVITPFLATTYANIDEIDPRIFSGSIQTYIEKTKPDLVISLYSAYDFSCSWAESLFEFR